MSTANIVYTMDFGPAIVYRDPKHTSTSRTREQSLTGTARYAFIHAHLGTGSAGVMT